jgi:glycosyltransferase involved in cell wall biosynthesis
MKKIKIYHIISSLPRGGRERQLATIVANTDFDEYPTGIIYFNSTPNSYIQEYGLQAHVIKVTSRNFAGRLFELHQLIKEYRPDVVYTWGNLEAVFALLLSLYHQFAFVNGAIRHGIRSRQFSHYFRTFVLHLSRHVVANSHAGLKVNNLKRGFVLYNGIDEKFLIPLADRSARRLELTRIPGNTIIFVSVANLLPYKDYHTVIKALERIKGQNSDFHYLILGDGLLRQELEDLIRKSNLVNHVTIVGNLENVHEYLKISDVFIHSSKGEGCSNAILEAMAAGLPIIATNTGGTPEIVSEANGFLFAYQSVLELANLLAYSLANPDARRKLGENSRSLVNQRFLINEMMTGYYNILRNVVEG